MAKLTVTQPGKRVVDLLIGVPVLVALLPVLGLIALLVRFWIGAPVIFRQVRPGLNTRAFTLYKFRTMTDTRDPAGELLPDGERLTSLGRFLRVTSLDELPEFFNVVRGDLSLVGPRPLLTRYLPYYTERERLRHAVRPGLTGWAQIHGRNHVPWDERLALDLWYVENWSLGLDLRILLGTVWKVLRREGVAVDTDTAETDLDAERQGKGFTGPMLVCEGVKASDTSEAVVGQKQGEGARLNPGDR
ncbi:MAG: sugar transferase [Desulfuromonadales bacterium]|nr:sugar transferase [Desulfuromonadales bacterium]